MKKCLMTDPNPSFEWRIGGSDAGPTRAMASCAEPVDLDGKLIGNRTGKDRRINTWSRYLNDEILLQYYLVEKNEVFLGQDESNSQNVFRNSGSNDPMRPHGFKRCDQRC